MNRAAQAKPRGKNKYSSVWRKWAEPGKRLSKDPQQILASAE
jgi:hypothetical protein